MPRRTSAEVLAEKIANRSTEIHRAYDRASSEHTKAMLELDKVRDKLRAWERIMVTCQVRATEQGYPDLL